MKTRKAPNIFARCTQKVLKLILTWILVVLRKKIMKFCLLVQSKVFVLGRFLQRHNIYVWIILCPRSLAPLVEWMYQEFPITFLQQQQRLPIHLLHSLESQVSFLVVPNVRFLYNQLE
jgi:hypothetical protein